MEWNGMEWDTSLLHKFHHTPDRLGNLKTDGTHTPFLLFLSPSLSPTPTLSYPLFLIFAPLSFPKTKKIIAMVLDRGTVSSDWYRNE